MRGNRVGRRSELTSSKPLTSMIDLEAPHALPTVPPIERVITVWSPVLFPSSTAAQSACTWG
jgi:hypothetical protein